MKKETEKMLGSVYEEVGPEAKKRIKKVAERIEEYLKPEDNNLFEGLENEESHA